MERFQVIADAASVTWEKKTNKTRNKEGEGQPRAHI